VSPIEIDERVVSRLCYAGAWAVAPALLVLDRETVRFANRALVQMLGYTDAHELLGHDESDVVRGLIGAASSLDATDGTEPHPAQSVTVKLLRKQGGSRQEAAYVASIEVDSVLLTLLYFHSARAAETRSTMAVEPDIGSAGPALGRAILEALPNPILIQDVETILYANAAARFFLHRADGLGIEGEPIASIVHPDGMDAMVERVRFVFETQHRLFNVPVKIRTPDGRPLHVVADAYPVHAGDVSAAVILATSVSEGRPD